MKPTQACLIGLLTLAASVMLAACGGDRTTAPDTAGVRAASGAVAYDEEPPPEPDGEFIGDDGRVYCRRGGLIAVGRCPVAAELVLACAGPGGQTATNILRGQSVRCAASTTPASATDQLVVTDWTFAGSDGTFALNRRDIDPALLPNPKVWEGPVVASGTVAVSADIAGVHHTKSIALAVTSRDWTAEPIAFAIVRVPTPYTDPPRNVYELGSNAQRAYTRLDAYFTITNGPNAGLSYFTAIPFRLEFTVNFNEQAMRRGSVFYSMQPATARTDQGVRYCARSRVLTDTSDVKRHEGFSATDANSHTEVYMRTFLRQVRTLAERMVGRAEELPLTSLRLAAHDTAFAKSASVTDTTANPYPSNCVFNYDRNRVIP